ncbi:IS4 family transposase [Paenibacillus planticolens]|uniref:IS4 family transposase n=1 Tax=Paenibacillus planticolens TaxID=2654976 RepID=A0ABX1ZNM5_9BACL|nr:IS4 family transposase [Paenibacillus planticolens]NOV01694.1 IS4 family transposase [Paenibacillus planticolens]
MAGKKAAHSVNCLYPYKHPKEEVLPLIKEVSYVDSARKFTVYDLFLFLSQAALQQWDGYRDGEKRMSSCGLVKADHSTISKKAKDVPFELFKQLLSLMTQKCNRPTRRRLGIPKELLVVDSTKITVGKERLPWAPLKGEKAGIKLHVSIIADAGLLHKVTETTGNRPDLFSCNDVRDDRFILVADRAYGKHKQFDDYLEQKQYFVIRLRDNTHFHEPKLRTRKRPFAGTIEQDLTCQLGAKSTLSKNRFRVVVLKDPHGNPVILATNLHRPSVEKIAEIYKKRWQIEVFFRWIKQHLNVPMIFGTTPNAVYGQLYTALLVYVLLKFVFEQGNSKVHPSAQLSFAEFDRLFSMNDLQAEWLIYLTSNLTFT